MIKLRSSYPIAAVAAAFLAAAAHADARGASAPQWGGNPPPPPCQVVVIDSPEGAGQFLPEEPDASATPAPLATPPAGTAVAPVRAGSTPGNPGVTPLPPRAQPFGAARGAANSGVSAGRKAASSALTWDAWWRINADAYVDRRARASSTTPLEGSTLNGDELSSLRRFLGDAFGAQAETDRRNVAMALSAWARIADRDAKTTIAQRLLSVLADGKVKDREYALLGLGFLADERMVAPLAAVVADNADGRRVMGLNASIPDRWRSFAAVALGASRAASARTALVDVAFEAGGTSLDLRVAAITALGNLAGSGVERDVIGTRLIAALEDSRLDIAARAQVVAALGASQANGALAHVRVVLVDNAENSAVRRAAAVATARLSGESSAEATAALRVAALRDSDPSVRHLAVVGLGDVAYGLGDDAADAPTVAAIIAFFASSLTSADVRKIDRAWYALGAGLAAHGRGSKAKEIGLRLVDLASAGRSVDERAAATLALGFVGGADAAKAMLTIAGRGTDNVARGYALEALGIGRVDGATKALKSALAEADEAFHRYQAAMGLAASGDPTAVSAVAAALARADAEPVRAALMLALGRMGRSAGAAPLLAVARDGASTTKERERAMGALGVLAQRETKDWNFAMRRSSALEGLTPTLAEIVRLY